MKNNIQSIVHDVSSELKETIWPYTQVWEYINDCPPNASTEESIIRVLSVINHISSHVHTEDVFEISISVIEAIVKVSMRRIWEYFGGNPYVKMKEQAEKSIKEYEKQVSLRKNLQTQYHELLEQLTRNEEKMKEHVVKMEEDLVKFQNHEDQIQNKAQFLVSLEEKRQRQAQEELKILGNQAGISRVQVQRAEEALQKVQELIDLQKAGLEKIRRETENLKREQQNLSLFQRIANVTGWFTEQSV